MPDFTPLRTSDTTGFPHTEWREVVLQHERFTVRSCQGINDLGITLGTECGYHQCLGFATGEQSRTMRPGQYTRSDGYLPHGTGIPAVDAGFAIQDLATHHFLFELFDGFPDFLFGIAIIGNEFFPGFGTNFTQTGIAWLFFTNRIGFREGGFASSGHIRM